MKFPIKNRQQSNGKNVASRGKILTIKNGETQRDASSSQVIESFLERFLSRFIPLPKQKIKTVMAVLGIVPLVLTGINSIPGSQAVIGQISDNVMALVNRDTLSPKNYSDKDIDYTELRNLLRDNKLKEANHRTNSDILRVLGKGQELLIKEEDIASFPCRDLNTINLLWKKFYNGNFGFEVQSEIWIKLGGQSSQYSSEVHDKFAERVGWSINGKYKDKDDIFWNEKVKAKGNLPIILNAEVPTLTPNISERIATCKVWSTK